MKFRGETATAPDSEEEEETPVDRLDFVVIFVRSGLFICLMNQPRQVVGGGCRVEGASIKIGG